MAVRVDFRRPGGRGAMPSSLAPVEEERGFESIYRNTLLNYESARRFRAGPPALGRQIQRGGTGEAVRIAILEQGVYRLTYTELSARGLPAGIPINNLAMTERRYADGPPPTENFARDPVPILVTDANQNTTFDGNDSITFNVRGIRKRFPQPHLQRYTDENVVWLDWEAPGGARIASRPGWFDPAPPAGPTSFPDTLHYEEDEIYHRYAPRISMGPQPYEARERVLSWYLTRNLPRVDLGDPFCVDNACSTYAFPYALLDVDESAGVRFRSQMVSAADNVTHLATFFVRNGNDADTVVSGWGFSGHLAVGVLDTLSHLPASTFTRPNSEMRFTGKRFIPEINQTAVYAGAHLDWWELGYQHLFRARNNRLACNSGTATGPAEFTITGFSSSDIAILDVTDALQPTLLTGIQVSGNGPYTVRFRDDVSTGRRRYVAFVRGSGELTLQAGSLGLVPPGNLATPAVEPDYIIVIPDAGDVDGDGQADDFLGEADRLKQYRESKGHVVEMVTLSQLANEFDGGLSRPHAIRNYLRHAFSHWNRPPQFLLLAGDGSEDFRDKVPMGVSAVPTELIYGPAFGLGDLEIIACDSWFAAGIAPGDSEFDLHMDLAVGRLPAQSAAELRLMIDKTIDYENFAPDDRWRAKTLTIADDAWSSSIDFTQPYTPRAGERIFETICDTLNSIVENHSGIGDLIEARAFNLSTYTDQLPTTRTISDAVAHFDTTGHPILYSILSEGNLLVSYQGHANQVIIAHERIFFSQFDQDQDEFDNIDRPGLWFVYACHPNDGFRVDERVGNVVSGLERAFDELLLALPNGTGIVAGIGSTGYEYIPVGLGGGSPFQNDLNTPQWEAFFLTPPENSTDGPRWILGEVVNLGKELFNQVNTSSGPELTYCILGDPALRIDAFAPAFAVTAADTVRTAGARIESFSAKSDTVSVVAEIRDEVHVASTEVRELIGGNSVVISPKLYTLEELDRHRLRITYPAPLRPENYDIVFRARDASGREVEFPLAVRVDTSFRADGNTIADGDFIGINPDIEVAIHSPVSLDESSFRLLLDGSPVTGVEAVSLDPSGKDWELHTQLGAPAGTHVLGLEIVDGAVYSVASIGFSMGGEFALREVGTYPNPFDAFTTFSYQLTAPADDVLIQIYTVSGRLVHEIRAPRSTGHTQIAWDGRDLDRNEVANGLYIFRMTASGGGNEEEFTGRIVRARQ
jgi:hypothetical protein